MEPVFSMRGVQDLIEVFPEHVAITPKGVMGFVNKGMKGTKEIPFVSIVAVQFKEAGAVFSGYIQFTIAGGNESRGGLRSALKDENTFVFANKVNNAIVKQMKEYMDGAIRASRAPQAAVMGLSEQLQSLAQLRGQGALSEQEFEAAKRKLIG